MAGAVVHTASCDPPGVYGVSITVSPIKPAQVYGNGARADLLARFLATQKLRLVFALTSMSPSVFNFLFGRVLGSCNEGEKKMQNLLQLFSRLLSFWLS